MRGVPDHVSSVPGAASSVQIVPQVRVVRCDLPNSSVSSTIDISNPSDVRCAGNPVPESHINAVPQYFRVARAGQSIEPGMCSTRQCSVEKTASFADLNCASPPVSWRICHDMDMGSNIARLAGSGFPGGRIGRA